MTLFSTLLRKHLLEARWLLGTSCAAFFGLAILTSWVAKRFERVIDSGDVAKAMTHFRFLRALGGSMMEESNFSTVAIQVCWWNHPAIVLCVLGWAISRGSVAVAGEIERGTVDLVLSRPVSRSSYLGSHIVFATLGLIALIVSLIVGDMVGARVYALNTPPSLATMLKPGLMMLTLGLAVFGYTLPFSAVDVVRWRSTLVSSAITLAGLIAMTVAPQFEGYEWLEKTSVFRAYAPVTVAIKGTPLSYNATVLSLIFLAGTAASFWLFSRRDIPSSS